jgi:branched-chain amino acid transport system permease protein
MEQIVQAIVFGLAIGACYGIMAIGFVLLIKSVHVLNMAQGELVMVGGYACYIFAVWLGLPFWLAAILTLAFGFVLGIVIDRLVMRSMLGQTPLIPVMATIGLGQLLIGGTQLVVGSEDHYLPAYLPKDPFKLGTVIMPADYVWTLVITVVLLLIFVCYFRFTKSGLAMRAASESQRTAESLGVNVKTISATAWAITCMTASVGGIIMASLTAVTLQLSVAGIKAIPAVVLGGIESLPGSIAGGLIIGIAESLGGTYLSNAIAGIRDLAPFIMLMIILLVRPYGLFGQKKIERI